MALLHWFTVLPWSFDLASISMVLKHRRGLKKQLKTYVITNLTLIVIWAMSGQGDFWPAWSIVFWGLALAYQAWSFEHPDQPISDQDIEREMNRMQS